MRVVLAPMKSRGMTLVEVLVALLLLSLMVAGLARVQSQSLQISRSALWWNQANTIATEAVSRVVANPVAESIYFNARKWQSSPAGVRSKCGSLKKGCDTPQQLAELDVVHLLSRAAELPNGRMIAKKCRGDTVRCIYVAWGQTGLDQCKPLSKLTARDMEKSEALLKLNCVVLEF